MSGTRKSLVLSVGLIIGALGIIQAQAPATTGTVYVSVQVLDPKNAR